MPCNGGGNSIAVDYTDYETIKKLSSLLCSACRVLDKTQYDFDENPALSEWWEDHKKQDEKKEQAKIKKNLEKQKAFNIAKTKKLIDLTSQEKSLLRKHDLI